MTNLFNNLSAVANGDTGAPRIQTAAIQDSAITTAKILDSNVTFLKLAQPCVTAANIFDGNIINSKLGSNSVTTDKIAAGAVQSTDIGTNQVNQTHLTANSVQKSEIYLLSYTFASGVTLPVFSSTDGTPGIKYNLIGANYSFGVQCTRTGGAGLPAVRKDTLASTTNGTYATEQATLYNTSSSATVIASGREWYVGGTGPYDMGDGLFDWFIFGLLNRKGELVNAAGGPDPIWLYNGPKNLHADFKEKDKDGNFKMYSIKKDMRNFPMTLEQARASGNPHKILDYFVAFENAKDIKIEITPKDKMANMEYMPHPFTREVKEDQSLRVVMLDPLTPLMDRIREASKHEQFLLSDITGHIDWKDTAKHKTPPGVIPVKGTLK
jgi:hypothetical protein